MPWTSASPCSRLKTCSQICTGIPAAFKFQFPITTKCFKGDASHVTTSSAVLRAHTKSFQARCGFLPLYLTSGSERNSFSMTFKLRPHSSPAPRCALKHKRFFKQVVARAPTNAIHGLPLFYSFVKLHSLLFIYILRELLCLSFAFVPKAYIQIRASRHHGRLSCAPYG